MKRLRIPDVDVFDTEGTGLRPYHGDRMFAWSLGGLDGSVKIRRTKIGTRDPELQDWLWDTSREKAAHNLKFDYSMLVVDGYDIPEETVWHCTMIAAKMVRNTAKLVALDELTYELGGDPGGVWLALNREVKRLGAAYGGYQNIPENRMKLYQGVDTQSTALNFLVHYPYLRADPRLWADYRNEIALALATQRMEMRGMLVDAEGVQETVDRCEREMEQAMKELDELTGGDEYYNLSSPVDVQKLLFTKFKLPVISYTATGLPCIDKNVLTTLREQSPHPVLDIIQKYRSFQKGAATVSSYRELADAHGILHTSLKTNHADTGREASENPNLQNVPKDKNTKNPYIVSARGCLRARPGHVLLDIDQSGIELRLMIEASNCVRMIELMKAGEHPHIVAAQGFYRERFRSKELDNQLYDSGKNGHFCLCYGGGPETFAETISLPLSEALIGYNWYQNEFPELANLVANGNEKAKETGSTTTAFGRVLDLPYGKYYAWLNYYIQGTAAGIIKRGQVKVDQYLRENWEGRGRIVLTVHDSIMAEFEAQAFYANQARIYNEISWLMTNIPEISVPLEVEWKVSQRRWNEGVEYKLAA